MIFKFFQKLKPDTKIKKKAYIIGTATASMLSTIPVVNAWVPCVNCLYWSEAVLPSFIAGDQAITRSVNTVNIAVSRILSFQAERLQHALAVLTKQKSYAGNQLQNTYLKTAKTTVDSLQTLAKSERIKDAKLNYGAEFGQGYQPCQVISANNLTANNINKVSDASLLDISKEIKAAPGQYGSKNTFIGQTLQEYQKKYCTAAQVSQGLCDEVGDMQGQAIQFASLLKPSGANQQNGQSSNASTPEYQSKIDFINQLAGAPDDVVPNAAKNTANASAYAQIKQQKDSLVSPALYSLQNIKHDYIEHKGKDSSIASMLDQEASRYMGVGKSGDEWAQTMAQQTKRGLMLEWLKIKGTSLAIQARQYSQQERMEANLAALVASELQSMHKE